MKKCIASFLICFVFAFGLITAFGCREMVYAVPSDAFKPFGTLVSGTIPVCDFYAEWGDEPYTQTENFTLIEKSNSSSYAFLYHPESSGTLSVMVYSTSTVDCALHYFCEYNYSDNVTDEDKDFRPSSFSCSSNGYTYALSFSNYYFGHNWDTYNYSLPVVTVPDSYYNNPQAILNTVLDLDDSAGFEFTVEDNSPPEYSDEIGYLSNLHVKQKNYENGATHQIQKRVYSFSWDYKTSTGVDLSDSRYVLDIKVRLEYKDLAFDDIDIDDSPLCNTYKYDSDWTQLHNSATNCHEAYSSDNIFNRAGFTTTYYFRILDTETNTCGNWLKAHINFDGLVDVSLVEETGNFDDSGSWIGDGNEFHGSGGVQNGDNESTFVPSDSSGKLDYSGIGEGISSLVDGVGQVPSVIAMLFSWLPTWVIVFLSVSIAIWGIMIVKKAIFG